MDIKRSYTGIGKESDTGFLTFLIYPDLPSNSFEVFREKDQSTVLTYNKNANIINVEMSGKKCPHILNISLQNKPSSVELDGYVLEEGIGYEYDPETQNLKIRTADYISGQYKISI